MTTTATKTEAYSSLIDYCKETSTLSSANGLLGWDQETLMPSGAIAFRGKQMSLIARICHERFTSDKVGDWLAECESNVDLISDPLSVEAVNVRWIRHQYDRARTLPSSLVEEEAQLTSASQHVWQEARKKDDFETFKPYLEKIITLLQKKAACFGWNDGGECWDALAEDYEPGCTAAEVEKVFKPLRENLSKLVASISQSSSVLSTKLNDLNFSVDSQKEFNKKISSKLGFNFDCGRLDESAHPFCGGTHPTDVRMTTRYAMNMMGDALGGTMHETGHGLYEQGLPTEHYGTPMGNSISLGIHESQSRLWENQVGRSMHFWKWAINELPGVFGDKVKGLSLEECYQSLNVVKPGLIRVDADEATYNLHIMIRFGLERALLSGDLSVEDLPSAWNEAYERDLGVNVPSNQNGCMQDIHWSMGAMGYFPTYTLGNLYAAQFYEAAKQSHPEMEEEFANGDFQTLLNWLRENIHSQGRRYSAADLCVEVTGKPLSSEPLMKHLESKYKPLYGLS